jgi:hypothetical protein
MRAILLTIDATPSPQGVTDAALEAHDIVEALISSLAFVLASTPSAPSPRALRTYCREIAEQLRRKTAALQADPSFSGRSEGRPNSTGRAAALSASASPPAAPRR